MYRQFSNTPMPEPRFYLSPRRYLLWLQPDARQKRTGQ